MQWCCREPNSHLAAVDHYFGFCKARDFSICQAYENKLSYIYIHTYIILFFINQDSTYESNQHLKDHIGYVISHLKRILPSQIGDYRPLLVFIHFELVKWILKYWWDFYTCMKNIYWLYYPKSILFSHDQVKSISSSQDENVLIVSITISPFQIG